MLSFRLKKQTGKNVADTTFNKVASEKAIVVTFGMTFNCSKSVVLLFVAFYGDK